MVDILITVAAQNNMPSKCFITFLNPIAQTERSGSNPRLLPRCLRSSHTSLLRRKVARAVSSIEIGSSLSSDRVTEDGPPWGRIANFEAVRVMLSSPKPCHPRFAADDSAGSQFFG